MTEKSNARFNAEAAAWDSNPDVHRASDGALRAILNAFPRLKTEREDGTALTKGPDILEIGCGTGLLSFRISPYVREVVAVDASSGMIAALESKLRAGAEPNTLDTTVPKNITPLCVMLIDPDDPAGPRRRFDMVLSHLVLHHIPDLSEVLTTMYGCLKSGGEVALTDFEDFGPQARRFHPEGKMSGVERDGINRKEFKELMESVGFADVRVEQPEGFVLSKEVERFPGEWTDKGKPKEGNEMMDFPFLLCIGRKP